MGCGDGLPLLPSRPGPVEYSEGVGGGPLLAKLTSCEPSAAHAPMSHDVSFCMLLGRELWRSGRACIPPFTQRPSLAACLHSILLSLLSLTHSLTASPGEKICRSGQAAAPGAFSEGSVPPT
jgi:hypothetical protein